MSAERAGRAGHPGETTRTIAPVRSAGAASAGGQALPAETREFFEQRFGYSFSGVRVHADRSADESARSVGARAYTTGQDITFASGDYQPGTRQGRHLLAHELAHVIQQSSARHHSHPQSLASSLSPVASGTVQRQPIRAGFISVEDVPEQPGAKLPTLPEAGGKNLTRVTINDVDKQRTVVSTMHDVRSSPAYVDNEIVSVGAQVDNLMYLRILALNYRYTNKPDALIPIDAIDFDNKVPSYKFIKENGVIYPLGADGQVMLNEPNTPRILAGAEMKLRDRLGALATREEYGWIVYQFAGAVAALGGVKGSLPSVRFRSSSFQAPRIRTSTVKPPPSPTKTTGAKAKSEVTTLTNLTHDVPAVTAVRQYKEGSGFSGAYDPATKSFVAVASGENTALLSNKPIRTVNQFGGHVAAQAGLVAKLGTTDTKKHVGFVLIWQGNETIRIRWNSGTINQANFGNRAAPMSVRPEIIKAVETATGAKVIE